MRLAKVKKGDFVARRQNKVMEWYLIQEGSVVQKLGFAEIVLERNSMIGVLEVEWFICDYIAREDTTLILIPCKNSEDLKKILGEHENYRALFLRTAIEQRHQALGLYQQLFEKTNLLHAFTENVYETYQGICSKMLMEEQPFPRIENFEAIQMEHRVERWEINNSNSLMKGYLREYLSLMMRDDALCVGAIMEAAAQMRRIMLGVGEMVNYLHYNKDILLSESEDDLFHLLFDLSVHLAKEKRDISPAHTELARLTAVMEKLGVYTAKQIAGCRDACENYDFASVSQGRLNVAKEDCVTHILEYAGFGKDETKQFKQILQDYAKVPDKQSSDSSVYSLRKKITQQFYDIYCKAFIHAMKDREKPSPILMMFFNFGFMDVGMLGEEYTNALYNLTEHTGLFSGEHVYTIYEWLKSIYDGKRDPSKSELDMDYYESLVDMKRRGDIRDEEMKDLKEDVEKKVEYEIQNMFRSGHRMTCGQVTTFCPVVSSDDFLNSVEKMALTAERIEQAINKVREIDYSVLYREITFSDPDKGILQERIQKEVLPDVILLPVVGTKGAMWQEIAGVKRDSSARFLFPIFTSMDVDDQMLEQMGRYRWEMCRRMQGAFWNDIRDKSLTAEYYDYIQFYKKNSDLSPEAKEKVKTALTKARNNYREVFVKDYQNWIKFESKGSFRLNKVARAILVSYCPFCKEIRNTLKANPAYETAFRKLDVENQKKEQRLLKLYEKYEAAGGVLTPDLKGNLDLCQM